MSSNWLYPTDNIARQAHGYAYTANVDALRQLLEAGMSPDARYDGRTPLQHVCFTGIDDAGDRVADGRAVRSNPEPACQAASWGCPGWSWAVTRENFVHVHEPSGISVRILVEGSQSPMVLRDGRGVQSAPTDDSTSQERAARANDGNQHAHRLAWRHTGPKAKSLCRLDRTKCPQRTVPAPAIISGALPSSSCNFAGVSQR